MTDAVRWEYLTVRPPRDETRKEATDPEAALNDRGAEGWELAGTIDYEGGGTKFLVFKRPMPEQSAADRSTHERPASERSTNDRSTTDRPANDRSTNDRSTNDRSVNDRSADASERS